MSKIFLIGERNNFLRVKESRREIKEQLKNTDIASVTNIFGNTLFVPIEAIKYII